MNSTIYAIALAKKNNTLVLREMNDRYADKFVAICDDKGTIEITDTMEEAEALINSVKEI